MPRPRRSRFSALDAGRFRIETPARFPGDDETADPGLSLPPAVGAKTATPSETAPPPLPATTPGDPTFAVKEPVESRAAARAARWRRFGVAFLALACLTLGAAGEYFLRPHASSGPAADKEAGEPKPLTQAEQDEVDAAFEVRHTDQYAEAGKRFAKLARKHPDWGMPAVELGRTQYYGGQLLDARATLTAAIDRGNAPADARFLLAMVYFRSKRYLEAESHFARAVALDPGRSDFQYFWGECLHRQGKSLAAAAHFRSAMMSNQYETAEGLYRLKWWLCLIEGDQEKTAGLDTQIDTALAQGRPPMEVCFAAAARDLKAGKFDAAVGGLRRARRRADPKLFALILADPIFESASTRPELAEFFHPAAPSPTGPAASKTAVSPEPPPSPAKP